ncbi:MAG: PucR family transcriptional regulator [Pseudomonadota bacterium]
MTQVITRYFEEAGQAVAAKEEFLYRRSFSPRIVRQFTSAEGLADTLISAKVEAQTAAAYQDRMAQGGGALLLVYAGYKPLGVAKITREVCAAMGAVRLDGLEEEVYVKEEKQELLSVLPDHPHFLTKARDPDRTHFYMADWPIPLISRRVPFSDSVFPRHARMANFPIPLTDRRKPYTGSMIEPHGRMANFPIPLISKRKPYTGSIFEPHARMANFPLPLISRRKPYTGTLIGRHPRMANWPFPHLMNGKTGTNSLMPGGPRMANFPIPLISKRLPYTRSIFARHARMANFPISLISKRKPYTGSMIAPHGRMAAFPWPLVIKHGVDPDTRAGEGFSLSKMFGWPTIMRRSLPG